MTMTNYEVSGPEEQKFLDEYDVTSYPYNGITADILIFTFRAGQLCLLLIERGDYPYKGKWALPGGFVNPNESTDEAALRELREETGLGEGLYLEQLKTYSTPGRDPRARVVSVAYVALVPDVPLPTAGDDAADARFFPIEDLNLDGNATDERIELAFDHAEIINDGLERIRAKFEYSPIAVNFLDETFTIADLRRVYDAVWDTKLHSANFRRKVLNTPGFVVPLNETGASQTGGRSAALYTKGDSILLHPALLRRGIDGGIHDTTVESGIEYNG